MAEVEINDKSPATSPAESSQKSCYATRKDRLKIFGSSEEISMPESWSSSKRETPSISSVLLNADHDDHHADGHDHDDTLVEVSSTETASLIQQSFTEDICPKISEENPRGFDLNSQGFLSLDETPVLESPKSCKKNPVIRLMGKNLMVMNHEEEEEIEEESEKKRTAELGFPGQEREAFSWVFQSTEQFQLGIEASKYRLIPPAIPYSRMFWWARRTCVFSL